MPGWWLRGGRCVGAVTSGPGWIPAVWGGYQRSGADTSGVVRLPALWLVTCCIRLVSGLYVGVEVRVLVTGVFVGVEVRSLVTADFAGDAC